MSDPLLLSIVILQGPSSITAPQRAFVWEELVLVVLGGPA